MMPDSFREALIMGGGLLILLIGIIGSLHIWPSGWPWSRRKK